MANETVYKVLQRTVDKDGNLVPVFPMTSADAVYYDVDKQITVKDVIDGSPVEDRTVTYNNIYNKTDISGGTGAIALRLPQIKNNTIEMDISASTGLISKSTNLLRSTIPAVPKSATIGTANIREMSVDGTFIFITIKRNQTYTPRLYRTANGNVYELPFKLSSITTPIRARFAKNNRSLVVYGNTSSGDSVFEVHNIDPTNGAYSSYTVANPLVYDNGSTGSSAYFDTANINGVEYLVVNNPNTGEPTLEGFMITNTALVASNVIGTDNNFRITNDIRISPNSMKLAFLTGNANTIYTMGRNSETTGTFIAPSNSLTLQYGWGGAYYGVRVGTWSNISFDHNSEFIYGTYTVGYSNTLRVCDVRSVYGQYLSNNNFKEVSMHIEDTQFDLGILAYRPVPKSPEYSNTETTFDFVGVGTMSSSTEINRTMGPVIRCKSSGTPTEMALSYNGPSSNIIETVYAPLESSISWYDIDGDTSLSNWNFADILIHPTSGYGYAIYDLIYEYPLCAIRIGFNRPSYVTSTNPSQVPIPSAIKSANVSYDGNAIACAHSHGTAGVIVRGSSTNNYVRRVLPHSRDLTNRVIGCKVTNSGNCVVCMHNSSIDVYRWVNNAYTKITPSGTVPTTFLSNDATAYISSTVVNASGNESWVMFRSERVADNNVQFTVIGFEYNGTTCIVTPFTITQQPDTHTAVVGVTFSPDNTKLAVVCNDSGVDKIYLFAKTNNTFSLKQTISDINNGYYKGTINNPKNNCAIVPKSASESVLVYSGASGGLHSYVIDWVTNTYSYKGVDNSQAIVNSVGMVYSYATRRLIIASGTSSSVYTMLFDGEDFTLIEAYDVGGSVYNTSIFANESGNVVLAPELYGVFARILSIQPTSISGKIKAIGKLTDSGWENVSITSGNLDLQNTVSFAIDSSDNPTILIGNTLTNWRPLNVNIDKITITGDTAHDYSYRIGYDAQIVSSISTFTNITKNTVIYDDTMYTKRIKIKGYTIPINTWIPNANNTLFTCKIPNEFITPNSTVNITASNIDSYRVMEFMGILPFTVENSGYVELYATNIQSMAFSVDIEILA